MIFYIYYTQRKQKNQYNMPYVYKTEGSESFVSASIVFWGQNTSSGAAPVPERAHLLTTFQAAQCFIFNVKLW